ncbi:uncharacterized protein LOC143815973 isoform X1 [Ranitomeya variabilis]|uniref:uncharacterized protein LOC143789335 n=1 Tax=Ranitomeya variabilis TaxID=490064 RepID=UPI004056ED95
MLKWTLFLRVFVYVLIWSSPRRAPEECLERVGTYHSHILSILVLHDCNIKYCFSVFPTAVSQKSMDFRSRDQTWLSRLQEAFKEDNVGSTVASGGDSRERIARLRLLLHKRTKLWWNRATLGQYLARNLIPRGLRVQIFPSYPIEDEVFKTEWENTANICSRGFIGLLIKLDETKLAELEKEIDDIQLFIKEDLTPEALGKLNGDLESDFLKWEQEISAVKTKKLQRDNSDYRDNHVYRWRTGRMRTRPTSLVRSGSMSSATSVDELSVTSDQSKSIHGDRGRKIQPNRAAKGRYTSQKRKFTSPPTYERKAKNNNLEVINLSTHSLSKTQSEVLKLGLNFVPSNQFNFFTAVKDTHLFCRKLLLKKLHAPKNSGNQLPSDVEAVALSALEDLLEEQQPDSFLLVIHGYALVMTPQQNPVNVSESEEKECPVVSVYTLSTYRFLYVVYVFL